MRLLFAAVCAGVGVAGFVGGLCALAYGLGHPAPTVVVHLGPLDGVWPAENYCFLGGVLAAAGGGLAAFGLVLRPGTPRVSP